MALADDLDRIAGVAGAQIGGGDTVAAVLATEPRVGERVYLCAFDDADGRRSWLAVAADGSPVRSRTALREAVSIAALCEIAVDAAGGGDVESLLARLVELRETEEPEGIEEAEAAARRLLGVLGEPPQLATPERLDAIGEAARRLERALDPTAGSPFTTAMRSAVEVADALWADVESSYLAPLQ